MRKSPADPKGAARPGSKAVAAFNPDLTANPETGEVIPFPVHLVQRQPEPIVPTVTVTSIGEEMSRRFARRWHHGWRG